MILFGYVISTQLFTVLFVFAISLFLFAWRARQSRGYDILTCIAYGFLGSGVVTGFMVSFVLITGKVPRGYMKTPMQKALLWGLLVAVSGAIIFYGLKILAEIKKRVEARNKMDLSKIALKILGGDKNYFRPITVPSREAKWRDFARASRIDHVKNPRPPGKKKAMSKSPSLFK
jgi:hypothetical protein